MFKKTSLLAIGFVIAMGSGSVMAEVACKDVQAGTKDGAWQLNGQGNGIVPVKRDAVAVSGPAWNQNTQGNSIIAVNSTAEVSHWVKNSVGNGIQPCIPVN